MRRSRTFPVPVPDAFDRVLSLPLETLFPSWYGPIPPVRGTVQDGVWGTVGQQRDVIFVGPGQVRETLVEVDRPHAFRYVLVEPSGPLALLITRVEGCWSFEPVGTGVRIGWTWDVQPRHWPAGAALPVFARAWNGYARDALDRLERLLLDPGAAD